MKNELTLDERKMFKEYDMNYVYEEKENFVELAKQLDRLAFKFYGLYLFKNRDSTQSTSSIS